MNADVLIRFFHPPKPDSCSLSQAGFGNLLLLATKQSQSTIFRNLRESVFSEGGLSTRGHTSINALVDLDQRVDRPTKSKKKNVWKRNRLGNENFRLRTEGFPDRKKLLNTAFILHTSCYFPLHALLFWQAVANKKGGRMSPAL